MSLWSSGVLFTVVYKNTEAHLMSSMCVLAFPELPLFSTCTSNTLWTCVNRSNKSSSGQHGGAVVIAAAMHTGHFDHFHFFPGLESSRKRAGFFFFSCFELEVNENKLASQLFVASEKEDQGVNANASLFPMLRSHWMWFGFGLVKCCRVVQQCESHLINVSGPVMWFDVKLL